MSRPLRIAILSDIHYASGAEQQRGNDYEYRGLGNPMLERACRCYRHFIWLRAPLNKNHLLDEFLARVGDCDHVFALGDYTCDTGFTGASDAAAFESVQECLAKLRNRFGDRLHPLIGDHDLGKFTMFGGRGGMRFQSLRRVQADLGLQPFWQLELGPYTCMGVTSSLIALSEFKAEILEEEAPLWQAARQEHLSEIREAFHALPDHRRILLFCHDPTALPYLWEEQAVIDRLGQIEQTFVGHLHSRLIMWKSRRLAGMPTIPFLGHTVKRLSTALGRARQWKPFNVRLCPSLAGIELLKDGGYCTAEIQAEGNEGFRSTFHRIRR